jgi:thioredoxin reductase (NADPH)
VTAHEHDVVVVGAGIAGLTAATTASSLGLQTVVLEQLGPGGQLLNATSVDSELDSHERPAAELAALAAERAMDAGATIEFAEATLLVAGAERHVVETDSGKHAAPVVVLATGARPRQLGLPGEVELAGQGVSYCVSCDGPLFHGRPVVLLGGGMYAAKEAQELQELASEVTVVPVDDGSWADALEQTRTIRVVRGATPLVIEGDAEGVSGLRVAENGREEQLTARGVFVCAGYTPASELAAGVVELDQDGRILTCASLETSVPGIYAVGDVRAHSTQRLLGAAADGLVAATAIACSRR